ncbi:2-succinyl-6-hydroxy-2,4-cyclohexadiene-1-carboxylate synthase [Oceanobacillus bengalensis]|uniref:Putative 2-succinyl-6-hydroxy-2,4-cyclohexadiene-1-carboxylate synthase n=1 Tax=Oceanobacillus bengalensis TaxID=1435466 RepID=A0A494YWM7_9BACI|nr:2-succinyl-6-hydroxy-2,4-cyclohexadiene-1-carboxylate synthase [Oceanobacillus bengalensis]RKQ14508.1 2-succinyl-6-hydroxy-2,4-cyclohexadiene-1-carboxylate synthase [Oceanobacillus bengalensis]
MYFSINDAKYWYEIHGQGIPVVLLHGFTGSTTTWKNFINTVDKQFQIITIDLPGHGKTQTSESRTVEACCRDLKQLFAFLHLDAFHLVGYSMGGRTALSFAMLYPEGILSLILESASPGLANVAERVARVKNDEGLAKRIETEGLEAFVSFWENIPLFETQRNLPEEVQHSIRRERLSQSPNGLAMSLRFMGTGKQPSWWDKLEGFSAPVLLIVGEHDEKYVEINKKMQSRFISCKLIKCEDAGHAIHVEKPKIFGKLVTEFILNHK